MRIMKKLLYIGFLLISVILGSCTEKEQYNIFNRVIGYMEIYPDSALLLLNQIPHPENLRGKQRADYALLLTQARDKNYLDSLQSDSLIKFAVDYYQNSDNKEKAGKAFFYYGKVMALQDKDTIAMQAFLNAQTKLEDTREYKLQALVQEYIGYLNNDKMLYEDALDNYQKSVNLYLKVGDTLGVVYNYRNIARIYSVNHIYDSVYMYVNHALSLCESNKNSADVKRVTPSLLQLKGINKRDQGDLYGAIPYIQEAIDNESDIHSAHHYSLSLGDIYLKVNKLEEAEKCFEWTLSSKNLYTQAGAYHYLYLLKKKQKKNEEALSLIEKSDSVLKINQNFTYQAKILSLQRKYERDELILEKLHVEYEKHLQFYFALIILLLIILFFLVLYFLLKKEYEKRFQKNIQIIAENECLIQQYVYEVEMMKQRDDEIIQKNKMKICKLNQKILLLENENKKIRENVCVNGAYLLAELKEAKLIVKNMTKQEKEQVFEYVDLIYGNFISRLKEEYNLTSGNLMLVALLKVGFTSNELMFTFDCEMNSIFRKKQRLRDCLHLDSNDKIEEFITLY